MGAEPSHLPRPLGRALRTEVDAARVDRVWRQVRERGDRRRRERRVAVRAAAALLGAIALFAVGYLAGAREEAEPPIAAPPVLRPGEHPIALEAATVHQLGDGSSIAIDRGARLHIVREDARAIDLLLLEGRAEFDVRPGVRRWNVDAGIATVVVLGTRFTVERSERTVRIDVRRGAVAVRSEALEGLVRTVRAGESLVVRDSDAPAAPRAAEGRALEEEEPASPEREAADRPGRTAQGPRARAASWRELLGRGEYDQAWAALEREGVTRRAARASASELLAMADVARRSGRVSDAAALLERAVRDHPSEPDAALAAFTLGRLEADTRGDHGRAAAAFERAVALGLPSSLASDARARLASSLVRAGRRDEARGPAREYLERAPDGPYSRAMRAILEPGP